MEQIILLATGIFVVIGFVFVPIKAMYDIRKMEQRAKKMKGQS